MTPGNYDLCIYRGDTGRWRFICWQDAARSMPSDFTGAVAAAQIRDRPGGNMVTQLYCAVTDPNTVDVAVLPADSALLPPRGVWDLQLTYASSDIRTLVAGKVLVTGDVTQAQAASAPPPVDPGGGGPAVTSPVRVVYPASGDVVIMETEFALHVASGPLAALTIRLPPGLPDNALVEISFAYDVELLIVADAAGLPVAGGPNSGHGPGAALEFRVVPGIGVVYWK
jgi:hypothetical protein